jgi:multidrug efflux pump subunit AcrB
VTSLTGFGLARQRLTILVMLVILALGAGTYLGFPKREDPAITVRTAVVTAINQGLPLVQIEELIARPVEERARAIAGVDEVRTQVLQGGAILQIDLDTAVPEGGIAAVFREIENEIEALAPQMPQGTVGPLVNTNFGDVAIATVAVAAQGFPPTDLEGFAEDLRDRLYALDTVSAVTLHGVQEERIWIEIDRDRLSSLGTTLDPVIAALRAQNVRLPSGSIVSEGLRFALETTGDFGGVDDIAEMIVDIPGVGLLRLGDLAHVRRGTVEPRQTPVFHDGEPAIVLGVEMFAGEDIVAVGRDLRLVVDAFVRDQPWGVEAAFSTFQPEVVAVSVNNALVNMLQTFLVVLGVMTLFLGLRQALVIASIVPFAVGFAFVFMPFLGIELQQVSITAIIISLGLLVDNGLVIVEDMDSRIRAGTTRAEAALAAGRQYTLPLLIASITTVAAFLPLFLLDGTEGQYGFSLGAVVALMLTGSFLSAVYLLPALAVWFLPDPKPLTRPGLMDRAARGYGWVVARVVRAPYLTLAASALIVVGAVGQMPNVRQQLFPLSERPQFLIYLDLPRGSDIAATEATALRLSDWLTADDRVTGVTSFVGFGGPRFVLTLDPADFDPASAFMVVNTTDFPASAQVIAAAEAHVAATFPEARVRLKRLAMGGREPGIEVVLEGPDANALLAAGQEVEAAFATAPGMVENQGDWGNRVLQARVVVAQDRARHYGLTSQSVSEALEGFLDGTQVSVLRDADGQIPIVLRGAPGNGDSFGDLANIAIATPGGLVSLDQIARFDPHLDFSTIRRVDQVRRLTVTAISSELPALELVGHIQPTLDRLSSELGPAYDIRIGGEVEQAGEVREKLGAGLPVALVVMLTALMAQFNSFRRVGLTLLCVPLVVVGVPFALIGLDQPLSFFGTLGLIALSGIIINNAIVLIDQIDIEREPLPLSEAIAEAARKRFRPILLTSLTTVLGLLPMALSGGALWEPMATLMIGGLGVSSVMTLFYVPALYRVLFGDSPKPVTTHPSAHQAV